MKEYLLRKRSDIGNIENHVFFFERVKEIGQQCDDSFYLNPHVTVHRATGSYTHYSEDTIFTISNLMGIIIVTIYQKGNKESWCGTKIEYDNGRIIAANQQMTSVVGGEFIFWMKQAQEQQEKMSEIQKQKVIQRMKDIGEDIINYDIYSDYLDDRNIGG